jgi:ssDNA-binding Zn-finger/Zn-ribbon topoisomerase 1
MNCPECGAPMIRRRSKFREGYWWGCSNWPDCTVKCAEHPDGSMMSYPATAEVNELRKEAHRLMVEVFGKWESKSAKTAMYDWLKTKTREGHIGKASKEELEKVIKLLKKSL